ncbi:MAG: YihA family ribosome biogenesis GTP-binding protein [Alloprevotella sp.]|nr:YihA family ribosome biogenesis GTP-binding protein [Alloprevotella sp.]
MKIKSAEFVISSARVEQCPRHERPEYAFIGRSNVGKSSLINMLTGRKALAMTSATPGKTMLINHFSVNGQWYLVDLPGYGYAKRSKAEQEKLSRLIRSYVLQREELTCLFLLIDSRLTPQKIDLEFIRFLGENGVPFAIVFTKADKNGTSALRRNVQAFLRTLGEEWEELPPHFVTSSAHATGRDELLDYIESVNAHVASQENERK